MVIDAILAMFGVTLGTTFAFARLQCGVGPLLLTIRALHRLRAIHTCSRGCWHVAVDHWRSTWAECLHKAQVER